MADAARLPRWAKAALKLPTRLYAHGLGPLLGGRFLQLTHTGRVTGRARTTVLEVVAHDRAAHEYIVVSGFGDRADWVRNVQAGGPVEVTVGRRRFPARWRRLDLVEAEIVFAEYERRNRLIRPVLRSVLSRLLGWDYRGDAGQRRRLVEQLPLLAFRPAADRPAE